MLAGFDAAIPKDAREWYNIGVVRRHTWARARAVIVDIIVAVALVMFGQVLLCLIRIIYRIF